MLREHLGRISRMALRVDTKLLAPPEVGHARINGWVCEVGLVDRTYLDAVIARVGDGRASTFHREKRVHLDESAIVDVVVRRSLEGKPSRLLPVLSTAVRGTGTQVLRLGIDLS